MGWIEGVLGLLMLAVACLAVRALNELRRHIEAMKNSVDAIGSALDHQNAETKRTLQAIAASVDVTANALSRIERAMPPNPPSRRL